MSTNSLSYATGSVENEGTPPDLVDLQICVLSGEEVMRTKILAATLGREVRQMIASWCFQVEA